jgi:diadenosine tetraphosphate (Ap4A) HIT family hydrolase
VNDARRRLFDLEAYERLVLERCFLCEVVAGNPAYPHSLVFEDDRSIAFLDRFPAHLGHTLVAPKAHLEQVTGDFSSEEYLRLQRVVFDVAQAVRRATSPERVYVCSLGSQQANAHVHWHVVPLPPGVPIELQQEHVFLREEGYVDLDATASARLAETIRAFLTEA